MSVISLYTENVEDLLDSGEFEHIAKVLKLYNDPRSGDDGRLRLYAHFDDIIFTVYLGIGLSKLNVSPVCHGIGLKAALHSLNAHLMLIDGDFSLHPTLDYLRYKKDHILFGNHSTIEKTVSWGLVVNKKREIVADTVSAATMDEVKVLLDRELRHYVSTKYKQTFI